MLIAQITDMHVSEEGRIFAGKADTRAAFQRCIAHLLALDPAPDAVLVSGDLAETGSAAEYAFVAENLARLACPVLAVPGNHDIRGPMAAALPGMTSAIQGGSLCIVRDLGGLRLIGLDTIVPADVHGELCATRLEWLNAQLTQDRTRPALIFMHHPPFATGMPAMDGIGLREGREAFAAILGRNPQIQAVLCGHAHRAIATAIAGVPVRLAPSSSHPFALDLRADASLKFVLEPPQIALHLWQDSRLVSHVSFVEAFPGPFGFGERPR
jgi:Icc protein